MADSYNLILGAETAQQIASAILRASGDILVPLGNDPDALSQLATGFYLAIQRIDVTVNPLFSQILMEMLRKRV